MANPEHIEILSGGADKWNAWRNRSPGVRPDLSDAAPKGNIGVDDPYDLYLEGVDFRRANMRGIVLIDTLLRGAKFRHCNLSGATLKGSNLSNCSFLESELLGTRFLGCDLEDADFAKATLGDAIFVATDLSSAKNLATVLHKFPSSISVDTLEKTGRGLAARPSNTDAVILFFTAAGVPQEYLEILKKRISSTTTQADLKQP